MKWIDAFLNSITMYRLVMYCLLCLAALSVVFGFAGFLPYSGWQLLLSLFFLPAACYGFNRVFSRLFRAPANVESSAITGLILFFILAPAETWSDARWLAGIALMAMASKYVFAIRKKHLFNPAALAAVAAGLLGSAAPLWWVGTPFLLLPVTIVGFLIVRKVQRFSLVLSFFGATMVGLFIQSRMLGVAFGELLPQAILSWPTVFFAVVMLTEPLTTPPRRSLQALYGVVVGCLYTARFEIGPLFSTPEFALVLGNLLSFAVSPRQRIVFHLKEKVQTSDSTYDFVFEGDERLLFQPGQYLEWTLPHEQPDNRGNRRYFTIASSPTEPQVRIGVKFYPEQSSFKKKLSSLAVDEVIVGSQCAGSFTLPKDSTRPLIFLAGGIGITPFRSMIRFLLDTGERRTIALFYATKTPGDIAYRELFDAAQQRIGLQVAYCRTLTADMIQASVPDFRQRIFYISGPRAMVTAFQKTLKELGVPKTAVKTDFFPGFV